MNIACAWAAVVAQSGAVCHDVAIETLADGVDVPAEDAAAIGVALARVHVCTAWTAIVAPILCEREIVTRPALAFIVSTECADAVWVALAWVLATAAWPAQIAVDGRVGRMVARGALAHG